MGTSESTSLQRPRRISLRGIKVGYQRKDCNQIMLRHTELMAMLQGKYVAKQTPRILPYAVVIGVTGSVAVIAFLWLHQFL